MRAGVSHIVCSLGIVERLQPITFFITHATTSSTWMLFSCVFHLFISSQSYTNAPLHYGNLIDKIQAHQIMNENMLLSFFSVGWFILNYKQIHSSHSTNIPFSSRKQNEAASFVHIGTLMYRFKLTFHLFKLNFSFSDEARILHIVTM